MDEEMQSKQQNAKDNNLLGLFGSVELESEGLPIASHGALRKSLRPEPAPRASGTPQPPQMRFISNFPDGQPWRGRRRGQMMLQMEQDRRLLKFRYKR
jgi:hypothetical protein